MQPPLGSFPECQSARLTLRPLASTDAAALRSLTDDPAITDNIDFLNSPFTLSDAAALIARNDEDNCFLAVRRGAELVGVAGAHARGAGQVEIGYWLGSAFHGLGYATEAVACLIGRLRGLYPRHQITAECRPGNRASWHLLTKLGFRPTGNSGKRAGRELLAIPAD